MAGEVAPVEEVTEVARPSPLPDRPAAAIPDPPASVAVYLAPRPVVYPAVFDSD